MTSKIMDEVLSEQQRPGRRCGLANFLNDYLSAGRRSADVLDIFTVVGDADVSVAAVLRVLARRGYDGGLSTINAHRHRLCHACAALKAQLDKKGKP
jgi:sugar phosphate isomerase/epimerase